MACTNDYSERIGELAAGRLDGEGALALLDHVEGCAQCSKELYTVAALLARGEVALDEARATTRRSWLRLARPALAVAAMAVLLFGAFRLLGEPAAPSGADQTLASLASTAALPAHDSILRSGDEVSEAWAEAMSVYAQGNYQAAAERIEACVAAGDDRPLVQLYLGIARLQLGEHESATDALTRSAQAGQGLLRERALWFLANTRLAAGDAAGAEQTFQELFDLGGDYELNAREKLVALRGLK